MSDKVILSVNVKSSLCLKDHFYELRFSFEPYSGLKFCTLACVPIVTAPKRLVTLLKI